MNGKYNIDVKVMNTMNNFPEITHTKTKSAKFHTLAVATTNVIVENVKTSTSEAIMLCYVSV